MARATRSDMETWHTSPRMKELLDSLAEDRESYPNEVVYRRLGDVKRLLEEYRLLYAFACHVSARRACLAPQSNEGPDGYVEMESGVKLAVQITVSDQSYEEAQKRKIFCQREGVWNNLKSGDAFRRRLAQDIVTAIRKKIGKKFHPGTDVLLVGTQIPKKDALTDYSSTEALLEQIGGVEKIPYSRVYVVNSVVSGF